MATEHSPAPWTRTIYRIQSRGETIAIVEPDMQHTDADADLMTAAPELLAALEQMQQANGCFDGCRGPADRNHVRTCQDARAAIAKARGE